MSDPIQQPPDEPGDLFRSTIGTSPIAAAVSARKSRSWKARILARLEARPSCLWEVAEFYHVPDHCLSGRFTELARDLLIETTGERRNRPISNCPAEVWRVRKVAT